MHRLIVVALLAAVPPWMSAQRAPAQHPVPATQPVRHTRPFFYPSLFVPDVFYPDVFSTEEYSGASQPPVILLQAPPASNPAPEPVPSPAEPLVIELQGDRYVRLSGDDTSQTGMIERNPIPLRRPEKASSRSAQAVTPHELQPVILVFRDSHREEVSDYIITDGVIYARADYYAGGSWSKKIALTSLDLAETLDLNRSRGVAFRLPSAPNEVITRP